MSRFELMTSNLRDTTSIKWVSPTLTTHNYLVEEYASYHKPIFLEMNIGLLLPPFDPQFCWVSVISCLHHYEMTFLFRSLSKFWIFNMMKSNSWRSSTSGSTHSCLDPHIEENTKLKNGGCVVWQIQLSHIHANCIQFVFR